MGGRRTKSRFLRTVGTVGIFPVLEIEADLIKAFLADKILTFWTEVAAIDDSVNEVIWVRA